MKKYSLSPENNIVARSKFILYCVICTVIFCSIGGFIQKPSFARLASDRKIENDKNIQIGIASWYGRRFHGRRTSSGERYNMYSLTAAHRRLPLGSIVKVVNLSNAREVIVKINDRGPYVKGRIIDLSYAAAKELRMVRKGVIKVRIELISPRYTAL
jgi:rare lipoprotein A (peptidoglycan hydrolase)